MRKTKWISLGMALCILLTWIPWAGAVYAGEQVIELSSWSNDSGWEHSASLNQNVVEEFLDYVWYADPSVDHEAVANAPAEYYTGTKPETTEAVYISHDIIYYPKLPADGFRMLQYDDDREWCYFYPETSMYHEYIFATLPVEGGEVPERMMHTPEEAYQNAVLHIQKAGTYRLRGEWHGQILIDLGSKDDTFANPEAAVRIILDGINVQCTVAPALMFEHVYECDNAWEDRSESNSVINTDSAGAQVIIADGSVNNFDGTNVYRMLRTAYKSDNSQNSWSAVKVQKKQRKIDGAFYSCVTMRIDGEEQNTGVLRIRGGFEGLDSELHLTVNGGNVYIFSQDDGINVNEDGVSVLTINGGSIHILAGLGMEGDGIDSNGYLVMNGGTLITMANPRADSGMDSDRGTYVNGGTVVALGSTMDWAESGSGTSTAGSQAAMNLQFAATQSADEAIIVTDLENKVVFAYDPDKDEVAGNNARWYQGAIVSSPNIHVGQNYYVYVGGDVTGSETAGVYDAATVTGFTEAAKRQCYSKTGVFDRPAPPDGGNPPPPPPGMDPNQGQGFGGPPPGPPPEFDPQNPDNFGPPPGGPGMGALANKNGKVQFAMGSAVNGFQAVTDYVGAHFEDVREDSAFYDAIMWATGTGIAESVDENTFAPDTPCTRGQTVLYMWRAAGSPQNGMGGPPPMDGIQPGVPPFTGGTQPGGPPPTDGNQPGGPPSTDGTQPGGLPPMDGTQPGGPPPTDGIQPEGDSPTDVLQSGVPPTVIQDGGQEQNTTESLAFTDVPEDSPYYQAVLWAVQNNITNGMTADTFGPNMIVTRAQSQTFLYRWARNPESNAENPFTDVPAGSYYYDAVRWSVENQITNGVTSTTFEPNTTLSKAQLLTFLYRFDEAGLMTAFMGAPPMGGSPPAM